MAMCSTQLYNCPKPLYERIWWYFFTSILLLFPDLYFTYKWYAFVFVCLKDQHLEEDGLKPWKTQPSEITNTEIESKCVYTRWWAHTLSRRDCHDSNHRHTYTVSGCFFFPPFLYVWVLQIFFIPFTWIN